MVRRTFTGFACGECLINFQILNATYKISNTYKLKNSPFNGIAFIHRAGVFIFFAGALFTACALPLWNLGMSLGQFVMAGGWLLAGNLKQRLGNAIKQPVFWLLTFLFLIHIFGLWNTTDVHYAAKDIRVKLPLLLMPLLFAAGPPLTLTQVRTIYLSLMAGVLISTGAGMAKYAGLTGAAATDYRELSLFISHIRLSLLIDVSLFMTVYFFVISHTVLKRFFLVLFGCWCLYFLVLMQAMTGLLLLCLVIFALALHLAWSTRLKGIKLAALLFIISSVVIGWKVYDLVFIQSIKEVPINKSELKLVTARGNAYKNDWKKKDIEKGRYIWMQYNDLEMDTAWMEVSRQRVWGKDAKGNMQLATLMRYLTWLGYSKDAAGIKKLTPVDIRAIEAGFPNPEYASGENSIVFRFREFAAEYRNYYYEHYSSGHSLTQRFEYWSTAIWIISKHPYTGVGTGDVPVAFKEAYTVLKSSLGEAWRLRAHNQYLSFGVAFGWPGILLFLSAMLFCFGIALQRKDLMYLAFLIVAAGSFLTEDTLETQAGVTFFSFLNSFLLFRKR